ncbi:MAG: ATP synthase F1 subunit gamma [Clostridium sp.]|nr:ATP synthase F1 subunit gamma [Clostridium sp.]MDU7086054.1 ATP synthase F1 subunit gamma [Clostridium sp.]
MNDIGIVGTSNLKKQIKSIEGIKKVTKAMALVSTSKLRKVRDILDINNTYYKTYEGIVEEVAPYLSEESIYLNTNESDKRLIIVIASDRGMCGGYNYNVADSLKQLEVEDEDKCSLIVIGKRGVNLCKRYGFHIIEHDLSISDLPKLEEAEKISRFCLERFVSGEFGRVSIIYTWYKNPLLKEVKQTDILPIDISKGKNSSSGEFDVEGNYEELTEQIILPYFTCKIMNALVNSKASEQSIRMETMNSATKSADDLISGLKQKYNRLRQAEITQEISEIVGGTQR